MVEQQIHTYLGLNSILPSQQTQDTVLIIFFFILLTNLYCWLNYVKSFFVCSWRIVYNRAVLMAIYPINYLSYLVFITETYWCFYYSKSIVVLLLNCLNVVNSSFVLDILIFLTPPILRMLTLLLQKLICDV